MIEVVPLRARSSAGPRALPASGACTSRTARPVRSRSWNRTYAQLGVDKGNFSLVGGRVWKRVNEAADDDNNPDIIDYMGRGDLMGRLPVGQRTGN